jgi:hypothetical protein
MRYFLKIIGVSILLGVLVAPVTLANEIRLEQYVSPLDCVKETIDDGVTTQVILSPQECEDLLNPKPPEIPESEGTPKPPTVILNNESGYPNSPNTGYVQRLTDSVLENKDILYLSLVVSGTLILLYAIRKISSLRLK